MKKIDFGYGQCRVCLKSIKLNVRRDLTRKKYCSKECQNTCKTLINCKVCFKEFKIYSKEKTRRKTCSKDCSNKWFSVKANWMPKVKQCLELAKEGKTNKEISEITGFPKGSVASYLNKANFRKGKNGESYGAIANKLRKLYKKCKICDFDRTLDIAHIIPAKNGGQLSVENTIGLCPNHHRLFDRKKLNYIEAKKLQDKVNNWMDYSMEKINVTG